MQTHTLINFQGDTMSQSAYSFVWYYCTNTHTHSIYDTEPKYRRKKKNVKFFFTLFTVDTHFLITYTTNHLMFGFFYRLCSNIKLILNYKLQ